MSEKELLQELAELYKKLVEVIGLFLYYSVKRGYPIKILEMKQKEHAVIYIDALDHVKVLLITKIVRILEKIPLEIVYDTLYKTHIGDEVRGPIDIPMTMRFLGSSVQLAVSKVIVRSTETPELKLLNQTRLLLEDTIESLSEKTRQADELHRAYLERLLRILENAFERVSWIKSIILDDRSYDLDELRELAIHVMRRGHIHYVRLARAILTYTRVMKKLNRIAKYAPERREESTKAILLELERLYQLYAYYIIAHSILNRVKEDRLRIGIKMKKKGSLLRIGDYIVYHDIAPRKHSWIAKTSGHPLKPSRPDITVLDKKQGKILLVADAKYRKRIESITKEKLVVLGYMNEYNAEIGALIFDLNHIRLDNTSENNCVLKALEQQNKIVLENPRNKNRLIMLSLQVKQPIRTSLYLTETILTM